MSAPRAVDLGQPQQGIRYEVREGIAFVTLDRPERGNSLTPHMQRVMKAVWTEVRESAEIRVAVIGASGERHFCTGFDVSEAEGGEADEIFANRPLSDAVFWSPYQNRVWKPVICTVNGLCVGGGLHFVVDADIVLASENAAFMDTHVNVGMVGALENVGLARRLPLGTALRMTLFGRRYRLPARRAYELGLVDELVATPGELAPTAEAMARQLQEGSPQAMALSKQAVWGGMEHGYRDALERAWALLRLHWQHPDFTEGPRAFAEQRPPRWNPDPNARLANEERGTPHASAEGARSEAKPSEEGAGARSEAQPSGVKKGKKR